MAKISELDELAEVPATDDEIAIRDISDTTEKASGKTKRVSRKNYLGYTEYVALLTQSGTNAPTAVDIKNDTGATATLARVTTGVYSLTFSSAVLTESKTICLSEPTSNTYRTVCNRASTTAARVLCINSSGSLADSLLSSAPVIVRIYV